MSTTNPIFYFLILLIFIAEGLALSVLLPFHRKAHEQELHSSRLVPLDGLRGILALSVFFTHASSYYFYEQTHLWNFPPSNLYSQVAIFPVSMFFFITAYLFWLKLMRDPSALNSRFLIGRLGRLAPAYFAACSLLFFFAAYSSGFHRSVSWEKLAGQVAAWLAFWGGLDINGVHDSSLWLGAAWTLRYEWMFYFSLMLLGWFARRRWRTFLLIGCAALIQPLIARFGPAGRVGIPFRLLGSYTHFLATTFSVGILVAILPKKRLEKWGRSVTATILSLLAVGCVIFLAPPEYGSLESLSLALPFACICMGNSWFGLLSSRPLLFLGRISYSFYLFHFLVLSLVLSNLQRHNVLNGISPIHYWTIMTACGMVTILLCAYSYQFLEAPYLHVGRMANRYKDDSRAKRQPGSSTVLSD